MLWFCNASLHPVLGTFFFCRGRSIQERTQCRHRWSCLIQLGHHMWGASIRGPAVAACRDHHHLHQDNVAIAKDVWEAVVFVKIFWLEDHLQDGSSFGERVSHLSRLFTSLWSRLSRSSLSWTLVELSASAWVFYCCSVSSINHWSALFWDFI